MRGLEAEEKILALEVHNKLRAKLANGLELRGNPGPQPSASNMMQLVSFTLRQDSIFCPLFEFGSTSEFIKLINWQVFNKIGLLPQCES